MQPIKKAELLNRVAKRLVEDGNKTASTSQLKAAANKIQKDVSSFNCAIGIAIPSKQNRSPK